MLFGTSKRLNLLHDRQVNLSVNGSAVNTTCYKYPGVHKIYKKAAGKVNLLRRIRSSIDTFSAQRIYQSMIIPIFTYCGYNSLGWSWSAPLRNEASKSLPRNAVRRTAILDF